MKRSTNLPVHKPRSNSLAIFFTLFILTPSINSAMSSSIQATPIPQDGVCCSCNLVQIEKASDSDSSKHLTTLILLLSINFQNISSGSITDFVAWVLRVKVANLQPGDIPKTLGSLNDPQEVSEIMYRIYKELGEWKFEAALSKTLPSVATAAQQLLNLRDPWFGNPNLSPTQRDLLDMSRGYGTLIVKRRAKVFNDPNYLLTRLRASGQIGVGFSDPVASMESLRVKWKEISDNESTPLFFYLNGSQAVNDLHHISTLVLQSRSRETTGGPAGDILFIQGGYGSAYGPMGWLGNSTGIVKSRFPRIGVPEKASADAIVGPYYPTTERLTGARLSEIRRLESLALAQLREQLKVRSKVGLVYVQPILDQGILRLRTEFLKKLIEFCTKNQVAVAYDEIFTGLRTGKLFGYQNLTDDNGKSIEPHYIVFGKAFQMSGIAITRSGEDLFGMPPKPFVTRSASVDDLLRSSVVLGEILENNLFTQSKEVGAYFAEQIRKHSRELGVDPASVKNLGSLIIAPGLGGVGTKVPEGNTPVDSDRLSPPLDFTKTDVDQWINFMIELRK